MDYLYNSTVTMDGNAEQQTPKVNLDQDIQDYHIILYQTQTVVQR
jgi:hypothetical protein